MIVFFCVVKCMPGIGNDQNLVVGWLELPDAYNNNLLFVALLAKKNLAAPMKPFSRRRRMNPSHSFCFMPFYAAVFLTFCCTISVAMDGNPLRPHWSVPEDTSYEDDGSASEDGTRRGLNPLCSSFMNLHSTFFH